MPYACTLCHDTHWVCETHPDKPRNHLVNGAECGGAGDPCPWCNREEPPKMDEGFAPDRGE
jgi:hypothetical protein